MRARKDLNSLSKKKKEKLFHKKKKTKRKKKKKRKRKKTDINTHFHSSFNWLDEDRPWEPRNDNQMAQRLLDIYFKKRITRRSPESAAAAAAAAAVSFSCFVRRDTRFFFSFFYLWACWLERKPPFLLSARHSHAFCGRLPCIWCSAQRRRSASVLHWKQGEEAEGEEEEEGRKTTFLYTSEVISRHP